MLPLDDSDLASQTSVLSSKLITIPPELLTEALKHLSWKDVLRVRKVCKHLSEATRTKAIWAFLGNQYLGAHRHPPRLRLERPIDMYTSNEFENLFLLWESAKIGWTTDDGKVACDRGFTVQTDEFSSAHLIQGGRWLLVATRAGAVTYYDLDAEAITGAELIPPQTTVQRLSRTRMCVDVDADSPMLSFRLASSLIGHGPSASIQLWQVNLKLNNAQRAVGLTATHLVSFPKPPSMMTLMEMYLLGPTIAFNGLYYTQHDYAEMYISVMDWQRASESPPDYAWRVIDAPNIDAPNCMLCKGLLQGNKLLLKDRDGPKVFDWSQLEAKKAMPTLPAPVGPLLEANLNDVPCRTPGWCFDEHASQFIYTGPGLSVYSFVVGDAHSESPVSHLRLKRADGHDKLTLDAHAIGRTCAAAVSVDGELWLTRYALSGGAELSPAICKGRLDPLISRSDILMDEESGRIVLHALPEIPLAVVIDFALVRKS